jgi:WD40 repeat protein/tetratricopeptide (TPR) repeat protein
METPRTLRIFFSSPGDVKMERETARNIVRRLQMEAGDAITIEPYFWEHEAMSATRDYQQNIPEMSSFDVVVCMLWSRLGTPLHPERHPRPDGGFFESGTEYEFYTAMTAFKEKGTPNIFVFRNHTEPRRPSRPREAREAADRELDRLDHFFERYFQEGNFFTAAVNEYRTLGEFEDKLSLGLRSYLLEHVPMPKHGAKRVAQYAGQPYLGLSAFDFEDVQVFYGRTAQVGAVIEALQVQEMEAAGSAEAARRFVLLLGASGSGKSSLARAGVLPMLVRPGVIEGAQAWRRCICKPGDAPGDPLLSLASALVRETALPELAADGTSAAELASMMRLQPAGAGLLIRQALSQAAAAEKARREIEMREELRRLESENRMEDVAETQSKLANLAPPVTRLALVVDQLEELFTSELGAEQIKAFVDALHALATNGRVYLIATLRSDFYARCLDHPPLVELMKDHGSFALPPPSPGDLAQMIRQPAVTAGLVFEENTATGDKLDEIIRDAAMRDPSALPLLSYTLEQLYEKRTNDGTLTFAAYQELGGLEGAIGRRAEETYQTLPAGVREAFDDVWRRMLTLSHDGTPVRRRVRAASLPEHGPGRQMVDAFIAARLLTADQGADGESNLSVAHEALLKHWPRLTDWLEGNRDFLRVRSRIATRLSEWEEHERSDDYLIPGGPALAEAEQILSKFSQTLEAKECAYISSSIDHAKTRERAKLRKARQVAAGAMVLTLIAAAGGVFAWLQRGEARKNASIALEQKAAAEKAEAQARASQVRADYTQGIDMLDAGRTRQGLTSLMQALKSDPHHEAVKRRLYSYHLYGLPKAIPIRSVQGPPQSRQRISGARYGEKQRCVYMTKDHTVEAYDLNERKVIHGPWEEEPDTFAALMSFHNQFVMNIREDMSCRIWHIDSARKSAVVQLDKDFSNLNVSYDGGTIIEGRMTGKVVLWDTASGKIRHEFQQAGRINSITMDSSDTWLAVASDELVFYNAKTLEVIKRHSKEGLAARDVAYSSDHTVAVARFGDPADNSAASRFAFFSTRTGEILESREIEVAGEVFDYRVNHDGTAIVVASFSSNARVYHRNDEKEDRTYPFETYPVKAMFSPDELLVIAADSEGTVSIFDADTGRADVPARLAFEPISHEGRLSELLVSWDGHYLMTSTTAQARIWDLSVGRALTLPIVHEGEWFAAAFSPDQRGILSAGSWGIQRHDVKSLEKTSPSLLADANPAAIRIGNLQQRALARMDERTVRCIDLSDPAAKPVEFRSLSAIAQMVFSPDETHFALRTDEGVILVDARTGQQKGEIHKPEENACVLLFSGDSRHLIAIQTFCIQIISVEDGSMKKLTHRKMIFNMRTHDSRANHLAVFSGGAGAKDEFVTMVWDLSDPTKPPTELAHDDVVYVMGFSDDARYILTGTRNQTAQVWDRKTGGMLGLPLVHRHNPVRRLAFSHDGRWVATASTGPEDDVVRIWDWQTAKQVAEEIHVDGLVQSLAFSGGDRMLLVNSTAPGDPKKIFTRLWELAPPADLPVDLPALTEAAVGRTLTEQGGYAAIDPFAGWEKIRRDSPDSWFLMPPSKRSVSPGLTARSMTWLLDDNVPSSHAMSAMPAVGVVRAAMAYWKSNTLMTRYEAMKKLDETSEAYRTEAHALRTLMESITRLRQSAERGASRDADVCYYLGMSEKKLTDYQAARKWTLQALELEPERRDIQILANDVLYLAQDPAVLEQVLDKLCAADPKNPGYLARKGYLLWNKGEKDAARKILEAALACPEPSLENRMLILNLLGRSSDALRILEDTEETRRKADPDYKPEATNLLYRIMCLRMGGDARQAIAAYITLVQGNGPVYLKEKTVKSLDYPQDVVEALMKTRKEAFERHSELKEPEDE